MKSNKRRNTRKCRQTKRRRQRGGEDIQYPPDSIKDYIKHVVYINLDSRTDRKEHIEKHLKVFNPEQVIRIPGVEDKEHPYLGCMKGHLAALELAKEKGWENVLILEDDAVWSTFVKDAYPMFEKLVKRPEGYDVIMLGGTYADYDKNTFRVKKSQAGSSYLVNKSYYDTIVKRAQEVVKNFVPGVTKDEDITPDVAVFKPLQATDNWFIVVPPLMIQGKSYSNILKKNVDYKGEFTHS